MIPGYFIDGFPPSAWLVVLQDQLDQVRHHTLNLFASETAAQIFNLQVDPEFSPIGWHLGHIAYTEALWLLPDAPHLSQAYQAYFMNDFGDKHLRTKLPPLPEIIEYSQLVRQQVLDFLAIAAPADLNGQARLWFWLIQHEVQHTEIIAMLLSLHNNSQVCNPSIGQDLPPCTNSDLIEFAATELWQGSDQIYAQDHERPRHLVQISSFAIERTPVTVAQYQQFMARGGYQHPQWWCAAGWQWLQSRKLKSPRYWATQANQPRQPVYGVSWYEASAYARSRNQRLPTESEWELAATQAAPQPINHNFEQAGVTASQLAVPGCVDLLGNIWEWTSSYFAPYPGFAAFPYPGYAAAYFDQNHYVLRGGSWATGSLGLRPTLRNWYQPQVRQIFAGFRCATGER
ncbi:MAG: SUMF1/EgtB/PvdO family nonheme iron enzyme [Pseudanabaenaceae cyanobacterium bins.68]|nr:SUMF1/EgtB/PvdO family nonheme iron enzyme [Pseudanabaenaceae cyanobacterium bins.68]